MAHRGLDDFEGFLRLEILEGHDEHDNFILDRKISLIDINTLGNWTRRSDGAGRHKTNNCRFIRNWNDGYSFRQQSELQEPGQLGIGERSAQSEAHLSLCYGIGQNGPFATCLLIQLSGFEDRDVGFGK